MADQVLTKQKLINADEDVQALEDVVNGEPGKLIKTRLGREVYTLASVPQINTMTREEVDSALSLKAPQSNTYTKAEVDTTFAAYAGGRKAYTTLALAQAAQSSLPANTAIEVTNDGANNGTYQWNGTTLTKSAYDPANLAITTSSTYSDQKMGNTYLQGNYQSGDYIKVTLRPENSLNARYAIFEPPSNANFVPRAVNTRACYKIPLPVKSGTVIRMSAPPGYSIAVCEGVAIGGAITADSGWQTGESSLLLRSDTNFIGINVRKNDDSPINLSILQNLDFSFIFSVNAVGNIPNLSKKITQNVINERCSSSEFWNGSFSQTTFLPVVVVNNRLSRLRPLAVFGGTNVVFSAPTGYLVAVIQSAALGSPVIADTGWQTAIDITLRGDTKFIHTNIKKVDDSPIAISELNSSVFNIKYTSRNELVDSSIYNTDSIISSLTTSDGGLVTYQYQSADFQSGTLNSTFYPIAYITTRIILGAPLQAKIGTTAKITIPVGYNGSIVQGSSSGGAVLKNSDWQSGEYTTTVDYPLITILLRKIDDSNISTSILDSITCTLEYTSVSFTESPLYNAVLDVLSDVGNDHMAVNSKIGLLNQAHGGITTFGAPFDSIDAIIQASKIGFKLAEVDIVMTADNEFVCMHDTQYNNTYFTNADSSSLASPVNVNSLTLAQAQSQFLQRSGVAKYRKPVQTVDEYFETCFRYNLQPYIEIKQMNTAQAERLANKAKKFFAAEDVTFISFNQSYLEALNNFGNFKLMLLSFTSTHALIDQVKALGSNFFVGVMLNTLTQAVKDYADAKNVLVSVWTITLNTQLNGYLSKGVRFFATDNMPPIFGTKGTVFKSYSSGVNFSDFTLNNAVVNGGVLELQAGGSAECTFVVGEKNIAFLSDIIGQGEFTYTLYVAGSAVDSVQISSVKDIQAKLNKLAVSTAAISLLIQATSASKISDLSFEVVEVSI